MRKLFEDFESDFFRFAEALKPFDESVVIVGGWLPFLYTKYYWKNLKEEIVFTKDIDLGVRYFFRKNYAETLEESFRRLSFPEMPASDAEATPVCFFLKKDALGEIPIDVISADPDPGQFQRMTGKNIEVINSLDNFDILLNPQNTMTLPCVFEGKLFSLSVPHPAAYLFHKGISFDERSQKPGSTHKFQKDLWSIFFVLWNTPESFKKDTFQKIAAFKSHREYPRFLKNLSGHFKNRRSIGSKAVHSFYPNRDDTFRDLIVETIQTLLQYLQND